jgi:carboxyl-terminal processing protease
MDSVKKLRGPKGSQVTISIMREGLTKLRDFTLTRDVIPVRSVRHELLEKQYGYIRVSQFQEKTDSDFEKAMKALEEESKGSLKGLILDLRNNPGGLLDQAVKVTDRFIDSGIIVSIDGRKEEQKQKFPARAQGTLPRYPLVVLVNGGSAQRFRNRRRRHSGPPPGDHPWNSNLWKGVCSDDLSSEGWIGIENNHGPLLYTQRPIHPGKGNCP